MDVVIICAVLLAAGVLYFSGLLRPGNNRAYAVVYVDGRQVGSYSLLEDTEDVIQGVGGTNELRIKDGKASIVSADCRDQICVNHMPVYRQNESIICLPHKVVVEIENGAENDIDAVVK